MYFHNVHSLSKASASLPRTSYFKFVDIWLLFCIGIIFLIIIFHTVIDIQLHKQSLPGITKVGPLFKDTENDDPNERIATRLIFASRVAVLVIFVLFNLIYWGQVFFWNLNEQWRQTRTKGSHNGIRRRHGLATLQRHTTCLATKEICSIKVIIKGKLFTQMTNIDELLFWQSAEAIKQKVTIAIMNVHHGCLQSNTFNIRQLLIHT